MLPGLECFLSHVRDFFRYNLFKYFLRPFLFLFSFWDSCDPNVVFNVVPEVSETVLISFHSLFFILFCVSDFHPSVFQFIYSSALVILLLILSRVFSFQLLYCLSRFFVL